MSALDAQIEREMNGEGENPDGPATDDAAKVEERRAKDRERKRRSRAQSGDGAEPKRKPGRPRKETSARPEAEPDLDPRVVLAVKMCMASMLEPEITPEFAKAMSSALQGALAYELEERLPLLADGYEPEVGLGCAVLGAGVTRFRHERWKKRQETNPDKPATESTVTDSEKAT